MVGDENFCLIFVTKFGRENGGMEKWGENGRMVGDDFFFPHFCHQIWGKKWRMVKWGEKWGNDWR